MVAKRAKKTTAKKRSSRKRSKSVGSGSHWFRNGLIFVLLVFALIGGTYFFGSFELRAKMEALAVEWTQPVRLHPSAPAPLAAWLDALNDSIPSSTGFVVEGGELGRDPDSPFLAGIPRSRVPVRLVRGPGYARLQNEETGQNVCIALRLNASTLETGNGVPLGGEIDFDDGAWARAMDLFTQRYPKRFDDVWVYLGPIDESDASPIPSAHYAIIFDLTDIGGLRALALRIPTNAEAARLSAHVTSIASIERSTGLQFLPEFDFSLRSALLEHVSPQIW